MNRIHSSCGEFLRLGALSAAVLLAGVGVAACGGEQAQRDASAKTTTAVRTVPFLPPRHKPKPHPAIPPTQTIGGGGGAGGGGAGGGGAGGGGGGGPQAGPPKAIVDLRR